MSNLPMRCKLITTIGLLWFGIAWFLPAYKYGKTLPEGLLGWEAFQLALSPLWQKGNPEHLYDAVLSVASALTNFVIVAVLFAWRRRNEHFVQLVGWACIVSLGLNAQWFLSDAKLGLRSGYFLWWISFGIIGVACLLPSLKREVRAEGTHLGGFGGVPENNANDASSETSGKQDR